MKQVEEIECPLCGSMSYRPWAFENGYTAVKCKECGLVYVNPRPVEALVREGVETGVHSEVDTKRDSISRRVPGKVGRYKKLLGSMFGDSMGSGAPIRWIDIGAGFGEIVEAVATVAPQGSVVEGIEPMKPKVLVARRLGLNVREGYLENVSEEYDIASLVNVFSHLPDFSSFLETLRRVLKPGGELFLETGNIGDLTSPSEVPTDLNLPDHLVFGGEGNIRRFLERSGFDIIAVRRSRKDTLFGFLKLLAKKCAGRKVNLTFPYTSKYRSLAIRARRREPVA